MIMDSLFLIAGLAILVAAGDVLVRGAVALARRVQNSPLLIGLTVVGFGTSAPELVVSIDAALSGAPGLSVGNVVGSNIANVLIVIGLPALFLPLVTHEPMIRRNTVFMLVVTAIFIAFALTGIFDRVAGIVLFSLLVLYLAYSAFGMLQSRKGNAAREIEQEVEQLAGRPRSGAGMALYILAGIGLLPVAAHLVVTGASGIAETLGVSKALIGLTIVALGTSLPELAAAIAAVMHRHTALIVGNVVGSNIFNVAAIMGLTALITDVPVESRFAAFDLPVMAGAALLLALFTLPRREVGRLPGLLFTALYIGYLIVVGISALRAG